MTEQKNFISEDDIQKAVDYLRDSAPLAAQARANKVYLTEYRKSIKAMLMKQHGNLALGAAEREAYADPGYIAHLRAMQEAVFEDAKHEFLREAADAKIQAWRTSEASYRAIKI